MALWNTRLFYSLRDMVDYLNGVVIGPRVAPTIGFDVDALTLIIDAGAGNKTVTFAAAKGRPWTMAEIVAQIAAADASLVGVPSKLLFGFDAPVAGDPGRSRLKLVKDGGLTVRGTGTANSVFGFAGPATPANDTVGVPLADTDIQSIQYDHGEQDTWAVISYV